MEPAREQQLSTVKPGFNVLVPPEIPAPCNVRPGRQQLMLRCLAPWHPWEIQISLQVPDFWNSALIVMGIWGMNQCVKHTLSLSFSLCLLNFFFKLNNKNGRQSLLRCWHPIYKVPVQILATVYHPVSC